jgi:hypothetical protein
MAYALSIGRASFSRLPRFKCWGLKDRQHRGHAPAKDLRRRWIILISTSWLPYLICPSPVCLALFSGVMTWMLT